MSLDLKIRNVKSFLANGKIKEALQIYINCNNTDFLKVEFLEPFIDGIVEMASQNLKEEFNYDSLLCANCSDIIRDPITLKCGHTFSKKCLLMEARNYSVACPTCHINYGLAYVTQLKNNVTIVHIVEKLYDKILKVKNSLVVNEDHINKAFEAQKYLISSCEKKFSDIKTPCLPSLHATTSLDFFKKGSLLFEFGKFKEAFKALLISLTLDPNAHSAKVLSVEIFSLLIRQYRCSYDNLQVRSIESSLFKRNSLVHNERRLRNAGSSDSLHCAEDDRSSSDEDDTRETENRDIKDMHLMIDSFFGDIKSLGDERSLSLKTDAAHLDKKAFECILCMRILWEPVTTTCGHTFCRMCLNRCLDHQPRCPLCKTSLASFLAEDIPKTTEILELAIKSIFHSEYVERKTLYLEEMEALSNAGKDSEHEIPLFVCTVALPTVPCPLHVFEPRYRLMIRQCIESGSRQFGMCAVVEDEIAEFGTMLKIRDVTYFPDGRSIVDTVGSKRFRILRRGERDGYHTGAIEFLEDQAPSDLNQQSFEEKLYNTYKICKNWLKLQTADSILQLLQQFGPMPNFESNISSSDGPSWLWYIIALLPITDRRKIKLLTMTSLHKRAKFVNKFCFQNTASILREKLEDVKQRIDILKNTR